MKWNYKIRILLRLYCKLNLTYNLVVNEFVLKYISSFLPHSNKDNCVQLTCITSHAWTVYCSEVWHAYPKLKHAFQAQLPPTGTSFSTVSCLLGNDRRGHKLHFLEKICSRRQCPEWITYQRGWNAVIFTGREIEKEGGVGVGGGNKHFCALTLPLFRSSRLSFFSQNMRKHRSIPAELQKVQHDMK